MAPAETSWGRGGERARHTRGECAPQAPGCLSCSGGEYPKRRRNRVCAFMENLKTGTARNAEPAPYRAAGSLSSVDGENTHPWAGANPVWPEHGECSPHMAISVCSTLPSPQQDWTELANLNKRSPPPACVRAEIRHWRDSKWKPNKQREPLQKGPMQQIKEPLQKGPVQQIKIPVGNTNYNRRSL